MAILDIFSKRQKRLRGETPDVFMYDRIPQELRVQITFICRDAFGTNAQYFSGRRPIDILTEVYDALCREYGVLRLSGGNSIEAAVMNFVLTEGSTERVLDAVELLFHAIECYTENYNYRAQAEPKIAPQDAVQELNERFLEHGIGYHYASGRLIRKDSEFIHREVIQPVLGLLNDTRYQGAHDEFLTAHDHYRHGRIKECLQECLKALESTLKSICKIKSWKFQPTDTAKTLFEICFQNGLVPPYLESHYASLRSSLESGVPTLRNKLGGHGQGAERIEVPPYYAAYMLHLTGTTVQFLVEAAKHP